MDVVACNAAVLLPHAFTGKAGSMEVAKARGTVDVAGGSSHIRASLAGKGDRREAKCGAAVKCKPILMLVAVAEVLGASHSQWILLSTTQHKKGEYNVTATLAPSIMYIYSRGITANLGSGI